MDEAAEETIMPPIFAKEAAEMDRECKLGEVYDRFASLRDMIALARVATTAVAGEGDAHAINGLAWAMHWAQEEAEEALADLRATMRRPGA